METEIEVEDEVEASNPRSSSHQAQVFFIPNLGMVSLCALISNTWIFISNPNLKSFMHVWIMECGELSLITKVRSRL